MRRQSKIVEQGSGVWEVSRWREEAEFNQRSKDWAALLPKVGCSLEWTPLVAAGLVLDLRFRESSK